MRRKKTKVEITAVRQAAARKRWNCMTLDDRVNATKKSRQAAYDEYARRRLRKSELGTDPRTSGTLTEQEAPMDGNA